MANIESGKGRDDLTIDILLAAEGVLRKISDTKSKSVRHLAENIKKSFNKIREVLRKYEKNLDAIDPQLKNNSDLVDILIFYETSWEKGKHYLLNCEQYSQLLYFSQLIEILCEKYKEFEEKLECRDPNIFIWLPSILIVKSLENDDKGICKEYNPSMFNENDESGKLYIFIKNFKENFYYIVKDPYLAYNLLERLVLFEDDSSVYIELESYLSRCLIAEFEKKIKILSMQLQRVKPTEWNYFFDLAMNNIGD